MFFNKTKSYMQIVDELALSYNLTDDQVDSLNSYRMDIFRSDEQSEITKPMLWIGMYIALASLICILAMVGDLLHGLRNRKLWFPCKYFTVNAAWLTVIAVAMKLPVDLTASRPGNVDQVANLGSMAFTCSMMANFFPSLTTMNSKELLSNIVALVVLVITLVVNICIQIATGGISDKEKARVYDMINPGTKSWGLFTTITIIYVTLLLMLLIIHICSSLAILKSQQIIESKYQNNHARALKAQQSERLTLEKLKQHVFQYWIMVEAGSTQLITVCAATTSASGVICVLSTITHIVTVLLTRPQLGSKYCGSDYQWSVSVILVTQFIGVVVATIAPLSRCFAPQIWKNVKVFETESYWIHMLSDWKNSRIPIPLRSHKCKVVIENLKFTILNFLIVVQKAVVVTCKMISLIPFFFLMCVHCLKRINVMLRASADGSGKNTHQPETDTDIPSYIFQFNNDERLKLKEKTLKILWKSVNRLIQKAEKQQPNNLKKLLEKPSRFEGVEKYDNDLSTILSKEYRDCCSLPVVTLTAIVVSLPNFQKDQKKADNLLESVSEAFMYVTLVEESLNATSGSDYVQYVQKAAKRLWLEVEIFQTWLGHKVKDSASEVSNGVILRWFRDTAKDIVTEEGRKESGEEGSTESGGPDDDSIFRFICATSMYLITETIMLTYKDNIDKISQADLIVQLSSMISDILAACLTNLPKVIELKCYSNEIEKREANVYAAIQLLGETTQIIEVLEKFECLRLEKPDAFHFIDRWRAHLSNP